MKNASNTLTEATAVIYEAIDKRIEGLVTSTKFPCRYIILMGAILINSDSDMGSYTSTNKFDLIDLEENTRINPEHLLEP